jgi:hypothetical protein
MRYLPEPAPQRIPCKPLSAKPPGEPVHLRTEWPLALAVAAVASAARGDEPAENKAIARHRMGTLAVETKAGAPVKVEQLRHEFWFGAALASCASLAVTLTLDCSQVIFS